MLGGNTTLETLIHLADALDMTLDELVFDADIPEKAGVLRWVLTGVGWYAAQPGEKREKLCYHFGEILKLLECDSK